MCSFVKISNNFRFDFANLYQNGKTLATLLFHRFFIATQAMPTNRAKSEIYQSAIQKAR